ncbi:MAG: class I SAM-dependent methyltransferase [Lachnospiraceae bacterium]|nr:class I SAM-dependent methyltransferase [Lachnospiraceae bacterium]
MSGSEEVRTGGKESVGNVVLNYKYYKGIDLYSEGESEDRLLELVKEHDRDAYPHVIQNLRSWSVMYHLSAERENICSWLPIKKTDKVLEIGSGCGAITGCLASNAGWVKCIELSRKRSMINATRHKDMHNIEIIVGNFEDIEPDIENDFDYITLIGVLEYAGSYISSDDPYRDMLRRVLKHLKKDGKLIIAIENQLGLKYFAGCKEDHTARFYEGIEGYPSSEGVKTFSRRALEKMLYETGYSSRFYYPYPDYKLPSVIYSDAWLPRCGELDNNMRNFDADRMVTFDESKVFDTLINDGLFAEFSNSFLVIATKDEIPSDRQIPVYAKFSGERTAKYRVGTVIYSNADGTHRSVRKQALNPEANSHVDDIYVNFTKLSAEYEGSGLVPNVCARLAEDDAEALLGALNETGGIVGLEFIDGITLEEYLDELEGRKEYERMLLLMKQYAAVLKSVSRNDFKNTDEFVRIFGERADEDDKSAVLSDIDMIFTNIVFDRSKMENGSWIVLDYEWTFDFPVPLKFIIFRALFYYIRSHKGSGFLKYIKRRGLDLYAEFGISMAKKIMFGRMEANFQLMIIGRAASTFVLHELMPVVTADAVKASDKVFRLRDLNHPKVYYGRGDGFATGKELDLFATVEGGEVTLEVPMEPGMTQLRVDPTEYKSIVTVNSVMFRAEDGSEVKIEEFATNGYVVDEKTILFDTDDAQIILPRLPVGRKTIEFKYSVTMTDEAVFDSLCRRLEKDESHSITGHMMNKVANRLGIRGAEALPTGLRYNKPRQGRGGSDEHI